MHRKSFVLKDKHGRKLGINNKGRVHVLRTSTHLASYSWVLRTTPFGGHGKQLISIANKYVLSVHDDGRLYAIHHSLTNKHVNTWKFRNISHAHPDLHSKYVKHAQETIYDHAWDPHQDARSRKEEL